VIVRKNDVVTESFDELLARPEDQATTKVTFAAGTGAGPGDTAYANGKLDPGEYIAVCFIPQGTTTGDAPGSGPPHAMLGMKHEFSVSGHSGARRRETRGRPARGRPLVAYTQRYAGVSVPDLYAPWAKSSTMRCASSSWY
jgi:hypothetical protein